MTAAVVEKVYSLQHVIRTRYQENMAACTHVVIRAVVCPSTVIVWVRVSFDTKTTVIGVGVAVEVTTTVTVSSSELVLEALLCVSDGGAIVITIGSL